MIRRRSIEVFSLSFLDCLCCGFGAILLLFLLSLSRQPLNDFKAQESNLSELRTELARLEDARVEKSRILIQQEKESLIEQTLSQARNAVKELEADFESLKKKVQLATLASKQAETQEQETEQIWQTLRQTEITPIGLPNNATHFVCIIDTSGSMRHPFTQQLHAAVLQQVQALMNQLTQVKKFQFLDTSGRYILKAKRGQWLEYQPHIQRQALRQLSAYPHTSMSDPAQGIRQAINDLLPKLEKKERLSLFVLGDDFRGSTQSLLYKLNQANPIRMDANTRAVSISAIGFPTKTSPFSIAAPVGNTRFANIMRAIVHDHGGVLILKPTL